MNDKDLLYFCKLVETQNYTLTANTFNVTQPTISMAIKRLQRRFGDPLISQKNRKSKIILSPAGELLYQKAKYLLKEMASIDYDVKHANIKKIRVAFSGIAGSIYILDARLERSATAFKDLNNGDVDVAIYSWMVPINDPAYFIRNLDRTELVIITGKDDPWKNKKVVDAQELRKRKFIARQKGYLTRECLDEEAKLGDFTPDILYTARTMKLMIDLVKRNVGIALAMENSIKDEKDLHIIRLRPGQKLWAYMQIAMRKSFIPNKYQRQGIDILRRFHLHSDTQKS